MSGGPSDSLTPEEQAYLDRLERQVREEERRVAPGAEQDDRLRELEEMRRKFRPKRGLYESRRHVRDATGQQGAPDPPPSNAGGGAKGSYQRDPRYKEFYDRLRREKERRSSYDEDLKPMTLDQLDQDAWNGNAAPPQPAPAAVPPPPARATRPESATPSTAPSGLQPGTIVQFDDNSVAIFKDSVSGKDYALFYFLEPNLSLAPRGIFLEQYGMTTIGQVPAEMLAQMVQSRRWDRDAVIFHLARFEHAAAIRAVITGSAPPAPPDASLGAERESPSATARAYTVPAEPPSPATPRDPLERGRVIRINVGGREWESVFWTSDEIGPIVAHDTNREWALMHLDLSRFKDAIEYGEVLDQARLAEIADSLARKS